MEVELLDDRSRSEIEVLEDNGGEVSVRESVLGGSVRVAEDGKGLGNSDGVGELDEDSIQVNP